MPIYEYRCDDCGHELEKLQRMSDDPLRDCPACEHPALRRLVSAAGFRLKGSGWYETDFKKDNQRNLAGDGKKPEAGAKGDDRSAGKNGSGATSKDGGKDGGKSGGKEGGKGAGKGAAAGASSAAGKSASA